ncbi:hypothetical protein HHK36_002095 [Tetracentron sinense]|uniref:Uncharacterized protein n=1 Tax=Tetracentron sinense TaxID=13715 RepID=A0A835A3X1_TETSI|nr:hypothetical protein HHK36_002095 [Tetracentron sinense]
MDGVRSCPLLTGIAAAGSAFVGFASHGSSAVFVSVVAGALASVVNTLEHVGQVGMVFEMYRNCGGASFDSWRSQLNPDLKKGKWREERMESCLK